MLRGQGCSCGRGLGEYEYGQEHVVSVGDPIPVLSQCLAPAQFTGYGVPCFIHLLSMYTLGLFAHKVTVMAHSNDLS